MQAFLRALIVLVAIAAVVGGIVGYSIIRRGLSAHAKPSRVEELVARTMRGLATPRRVRAMTNPVRRTEAVFTEGLEHYSDHCAVCHGNNGSGNTEIGRGLYPPPPDMRAAATQELSDGELFSIIENGIRLTGMPAWGTGKAEGERASWVLVHFIRRLPKLTDEEISRMESLNPKSPEQWREEEEARQFLAGDDGHSRTAPQHEHDGSHK